MSLETYLKGNPLMDLTVAGLSQEKMVFNTVDECIWNDADLSMAHEKMSGKIAFINGCLELKRDSLLEKKANFKSTEAKTWVDAKNTQTDANGKPLSDKRVDMLVQYSEPLIDLNNEILTVASEVRKLQAFVEDLRGTKVAMETILKTRVI